jgi:arginine-tRNA-protein transferase
MLSETSSPEVKMNDGLRFLDGPSPCVYLPDRQASLEFEFVAGIRPEEYEQRMNLGWRKFGRILFHPVCRGCSECRVIRVPVDEFRPDRSQRRALKRNADLIVKIGRPIVDRERLDLWNRYHFAQRQSKGWPFEPVSAGHYDFTYVQNPTPSLEVAAFEDQDLVAVALLDVTPSAISGIYHYHDPHRADRGLGKFIMLRCFDVARSLGKTYFYLGYYVSGCAAMAYKATFKPHEILGPEGSWRRDSA